jgi:hypothetical protein
VAVTCRSTNHLPTLEVTYRSCLTNHRLARGETVICRINRRVAGVEVICRDQDFKPPFSGGGGSYLPERPHGTGNYLPERPQRPPPNTGSYLPERPNGPPPNTGGYLPERPHGPPPNTGSYLPERPHRPPPNTGSYLPLPGKPNPDDFYGNSILPAEPRYPYRYDFLKDGELSNEEFQVSLGH